MSELPPNYKQIRSAMFYGFCELVLEGSTIYSRADLIGEPLVRTMAHEADRIPHIFRRSINDWPNTTRATLFPPDAPNTPPLARNVLNSSRLATTTHCFAEFIADTVRDLGPLAAPTRGTIPTLESWTPNRIGFNYMNGSPSQPAEIPQHTDVPEEAGLVVAIGLKGPDAGTLSLIFGKDTCESLGLEQSIHGALSTENRVGVTIAQLNPRL